MSDAESEEMRRYGTVVDLVSEDYRRANDFISRLLTLRTGLAGVAATGWTAGIGLAASLNQPVLCFVIAMFLAVLLLLDLSYSAHYQTLRLQCRRIEQGLNAYLKALHRTHGRDSTMKQLRRSLGQIELGQVTHLRALTLRGVREAWDLRSSLLAVLLAASVVAGFLVSEGPSGPLACFRTQDGGVATTQVLPTVVEGELTLLPC